MALLPISPYEPLRHRIQPGDIIAFSGQGISSEIVKVATRSEVSHVGIILRCEMQRDLIHPQLMESSPIEGFHGVAISDLEDRITNHKGNMWWLPLRTERRQRLQLEKFQKFLLAQDKKGYDPFQAINSGLSKLHNIPGIGRFTRSRENLDRLFCSELAAAALKKGGVLPGVNPSGITPSQLCQLAIYQPKYHLLKSVEETQIVAYNSMAPTALV